MAHSDYTTRGLTLPLCPSAVVPLAISELATSIVIASYSSPTSDAIRLGSAAMLVTDDTEETVEIVAQAGTTLTIARGCGDTIPQAHAAGATIWFFDDYLASDEVEYAGNATIGAKPLPRTVTRGPVPVESSPASEVTFAFRFARPYPPGLVEVNGDPWFTVLTMEEGVLETLTLTWAHRNRITQADLLVDHSEASITPEVGTTYRIDVYSAADVLLETYAGIDDDTWAYSREQAVIDSGEVTGDVETGYLILTAERDGYDSWQSYRIDFEFESTPSIAVTVGTSVSQVAGAKQPTDDWLSRLTLAYMGPPAGGIVQSGSVFSAFFQDTLEAWTETVSYMTAGDKTIDQVMSDFTSIVFFTPYLDTAGWTVSLVEAFGSIPKHIRLTGPVGEPEWAVSVIGPNPPPAGASEWWGFNQQVLGSGSKIVTVTFSGTPASGDHFKITLDGIEYRYIYQTGDTVDDVAAALAALIDAETDFAASSVGGVVTIDGLVSTNDYTYSASAYATLPAQSDLALLWDIEN